MGVGINMDLSIENRHSMGKCLLGNSAAEKANGLKPVEFVSQSWKAVALNIPI